VPTAFSGGWPITGKRISGDVRDFNVIFDATAVSAQVTVHDGLQIPAGDGATRFVLALEDGTANGLGLSKDCLVVAGEPVVITGMCLQVIIRDR
jgi:environmental stress-induced protein Ves